MTTTTDHQLLERWSLQGDAGAFTELVHRHGRMVLGVGRRIVRDRALADDLAQDCFARLVEPGAVPRGSLAGWLHRVATHRAVSALRSQIRPGTRPLDDTEACAGPDPAQQVARRDLESQVDQAIAELSAPFREALVGHFLQARSQVDLARDAGVAERTAAYRIKRGIDEVRGTLGHRGIAVETSALATALIGLPAPAALAPQWVAGIGRRASAEPSVTHASAGASLGGLAATGSAKILVCVAVAVLSAFGVWWAALGAVSRQPTSRAAPLGAATVTSMASDTASVTLPERRPMAGQASRLGPDAEASAQVAGIVRTVAGAPLPGARVVLAELEPASGVSWMQLGDPERPTIATTVSGPDGRFTLPRHLPERRAWAHAFLPGHAMDRRWLDPNDESDLVLELIAGRTFQGGVVDAMGHPVVDAVVSVDQCWRENDFAEASSAVAITDAQGEFALGIDAGAVACTLAVDSSELGHDVFVGVPTNTFAELRWHARATVQGRVTSMTPEQVGRIEVEVVGSLPNPPIPVTRLDLSMVRFSAPVAVDGSYRVEGIQPGLTYRARLVDVPPGTASDASRLRLSPDDVPRFELAAGETIERNFELSAPILLSGRVVTARDGRSLQGIRILVQKDGETLRGVRTETSAQGRFEARLTAGPGRYRFRAQPRHAVEPDEEGAGWTERDLEAGQRAEVELRLAEPLVLRMRVVDAAGEPVESVRTELRVCTASGQEAVWGDSMRLDGDGRGALEVFGTYATLWLHAGVFPSGPRRSVTLEQPSPTSLTEELLLVLPDACSLGARIVDADGAPVAEQLIFVTAHYEDGERDQASGRTDAAGRLQIADVFRAGAAARITVFVRDVGSAERRLPPTASGAISELGWLTVE